MNLNRVFVPNRGEVVKRIAKTCRKLGFKVYGMLPKGDSDLDYKTYLDDFVEFDENTENEFLNVSKIIDYANRFDCGLLHPGWGFLSESAQLAKACDEAGIRFVGPNWRHLEIFGDKEASKTAIKNFVSLPGSPPVGDDLLTWVRNNLPVVVKAKFGGGGRGMRKVDSIDKFDEILQQCRRESKYFGRDDVFVEKCIEKAKHVEFQVARSNKTVIFGTRDCTVQRRHQKLIEEAPADIPDFLQQITECNLIRFFDELGYRGLATVEFLFDGKQLYFLEVNPRLQVEHTVTEEIFGIDLVEIQISIAIGETSLPSVTPKGHSVQLRLNAEGGIDFEPDFGQFEKLHLPDCRIENTYSVGNRVNPNFDNLIAKLVFKGESRDDALKHAALGLIQSHIKGVRTNQAVLLLSITSKDFRANTHYTTWLEDNRDALRPKVEKLERFLASRNLSEGLFGFTAKPTGAFLEIDLPK